MMRLYNSADNYVNFLTRIKTQAEERKVKYLRKRSQQMAREVGIGAFRKKQFWNNIGRSRFEVQNAENPEL